MGERIYDTEGDIEKNLENDVENEDNGNGVENEDNGEEPQIDEKTRKRNKIIIIVTFVTLGVILILYSVYLFEAYKQNWFPFTQYVVETPPPGAVLPNGPTSKNLPRPEVDQDSEDFMDSIAQLTEVTEDWYASDNAIPVPTGQQPL